MAKLKQLSYKKLKKIWYAKLAKSGFIDIETKTGRLKGGSWDSKYNDAGRLINPATYHKAKEEYYYLANELLSTYKFESELHKAIWTYHAEGLSARSIAKILDKLPVKKTFASHTAVWLIIKKYKDIIKKRVK